MTKITFQRQPTLWKSLTENFYDTLASKSNKDSVAGWLENKTKARALQNIKIFQKMEQCLGNWRSTFMTTTTFTECVPETLFLPGDRFFFLAKPTTMKMPENQSWHSFYICAAFIDIKLLHIAQHSITTNQNRMNSTSGLSILIIVRTTNLRWVNSYQRLKANY